MPELGVNWLREEITKQTLNNELFELAGEVVDEVLSATQKFGPFHSAHEGFAILNEEFDELKAHVWVNQKKRDLPQMRKEAMQVAAMAIRFMHDVCDEKRGRV